MADESPMIFDHSKAVTLPVYNENPLIIRPVARCLEM
jgi:hypothetical protein